MCNCHSFIVTRAGKVFFGLGITESHSTIREWAGLGENDSSAYAFEWRPPAGWPDADFNLGLTQDTAPFPHWELNAKHLKAIDLHLRGRYPTMGAWEAPEKIATIQELKAHGWVEVLDGATVSPKDGDRFFAASGTITVVGQTGGRCWGYNNCTINSTGQTGGDCRGYDNCTVNSTGQTGGDCWGYGNCTINSTGQTGGYCWGYGNCTVNHKGASC